MKKVRVPLWQQPRGYATINPAATDGAVIGRNVWNADGSLFVPGAVATPAPGNSVGVTLWRLVQEIPPNVTALAQQSGTGLYAITGAGRSATRAITSATLKVQHGDGVADDPAVDLPELPDTGGGTLKKLERDQYGRVAGTSEATTDDLPEGEGNRYFTDERARAAAVTDTLDPDAADRAPSGRAVAEAIGALDAEAVGAEPAGTMADHVEASDPHPQYVRAATLAELIDADDDAEAAAAGVQVGGLYRSGSAVMVRVA